MHITNENLLKTLRTQAWERAKGELGAALQTYWGLTPDNHFHEMEKATRKFIEHVQNEGLTE